MTIGEKIRYFRKQRGMNQLQLAESAGIHHVSIRKYETNRSQPQFSQIEKISQALNISTNVFVDSEAAHFRFETVGDLMGILIILCNSKIISITGERTVDGFISNETISIRINPVLASFFAFCTDNYSNGKTLLTLNEIHLLIANPLILPDILKWERISHLYDIAISKHSDNANEATKLAFKELSSIKEQFELEMQRSMIHLDLSDGIRVRMTEY